MRGHVAAVATLLTHWGHDRGQGVRAALWRETDPLLLPGTRRL